MTFWKTAWAVAFGLMLAQVMTIVFVFVALAVTGVSLLAALHP